MPEVVAAIDKLVDSAIEATLFRYLALCEPVSQPVVIEFVGFANQ